MTLKTFKKAWPTVKLTAIVHAGLGNVYDQGARPTCLALSFTHAHECTRKGQEPLSSEYLFWASRQRDGLAPNAAHSTLSATQSALKEVGQPSSRFWSYDPARVIDARYSPPSNLGTLHKKPCTRPSLSVAALCDIVSNGKAPVIIVRVIEPDFIRARNGVVAVGGAGSTISKWLHALTVVGWGKSDNDEIMFLVRNSWGEDWGIQGYALLPEAYLNAHLRHVVVLN